MNKQQQEKTKDLLGIAEAAQIAGLSRPSLYYRMKKGEIETLLIQYPDQLKPSRMIKRAELMRWVAEREQLALNNDK